MSAHTHYCKECGSDWNCVSSLCAIPLRCLCPDHYIEFQRDLEFVKTRQVEVRQEIKRARKNIELVEKGEYLAQVSKKSVSHLANMIVLALKAQFGIPSGYDENLPKLILIVSSIIRHHLAEDQIKVE